MVPLSNFRVRLNASRVPKKLVGTIALYKWCGHNWFEIRILSQMDSSGVAEAEFLFDGQVIRIKPLHDNIVFRGEQGSFVDARLGGVVMDSLLQPIVYCGCHNLIEQCESESYEENEEIDKDRNSSEEEEVDLIAPLSSSAIRNLYSEKSVVETRRSHVRHVAVLQGSQFATHISAMDITVICIALFFSLYIYALKRPVFIILIVVYC